MEDLPSETILNLALFLPDISNLCLANKRFNDVICNSDYFWREKFIKDYGYIEYEGSWKELYMKFRNVWSFGSNNQGQLGIGPFDVTLSEMRKLYIRPPEIGFVETHFPTVIPQFKAKQVSAGEYYCIAIYFESNVWAFGSNESGRLGLGEDIEYVDIPTKLPDLKALQVSAGSGQTLVIDLENNLWVFGYLFGELMKLSDDFDAYTPVQIPNLKIKQISTGSYHSLMIDLEDNALIMGDNDGKRINT